MKCVETVIPGLLSDFSQLNSACGLFIHKFLFEAQKGLRVKESTTEEMHP